MKFGARTAAMKPHSKGKRLFPLGRDDRLLANTSQVFSTGTVVSNYWNAWSTWPQYAAMSRPITASQQSVYSIAPTQKDAAG